MDNRPIHYEPHPVSPERKAELVKAGYRIVDAIYAPNGGAKAIDAGEMKIKVKADNAEGFLMVSKAEFDLNHHEILDMDAKAADALRAQIAGDRYDNELRIAKGRFGKLYLKRGKEVHSGPFASKEDAEAALAKEMAA